MPGSGWVLAARALLVAASCNEAAAAQTEARAAIQTEAGPEAGGATHRQQARELGYRGVRAYGAGEYAAASEHLERSYALLPVPSLGLWSARALARLGYLLHAEQRYRAVAELPEGDRAPGVQRAARVTAALELAELSPRIPELVIRLVGASPEEIEVLLDGAPLTREQLGQPLRVDPGPHQLTGIRQSDRSVLQLVLAESTREFVSLRFGEPQPRALAGMQTAPDAVSTGAARDYWRTGAWIAVGVAGASAAVSAVSYVLGSRERGALQESGACNDETCRRNVDLGRYDALRTTQVVSLVVGLSLGAAGAAVFVLAPSPDAASHRPSASVRVAPGTAFVSVSASF